MDRPANGHPFLIRKSEDGASEEQMSEALKGAPVPAQMAQPGTGAPPPAMEEAEKAPPAVSEAPAAAPATESEVEVEGPALVLPVGAKEPLTAALKGVYERVGGICKMLESASEAEGAEMPSEPIVAIADAAGAMAGCIEPYVAKQAGLGMTPPPAGPEGQQPVGKAEGAPWTQEYIDSLNDFCFLYVDPGTERDSEWRAVPLSRRKFPIKDHAGRLCLPMVLSALSQIEAGTDPFLSPQRKRRLLIDLASDRLWEAKVAAVREEPMLPETGAELVSIAEMIARIGGMAPAAPAPVQAAAPAMPTGEAAVTQAAPAMAEEQTMSAFTKACADRIREVAEIRKQASSDEVRKASAEKLDEVSKALAAIKASVEASFGAPTPVESAAPASGNTEVTKSESAAPVEPPAPAPEATAKLEELAKSLADKGAEVESAKAELASAKVELTKAQQDLSAVRAELAKANRRVASSNVETEERTDVAKAKGPSAFAYVTDLNEVLKAEAEAEARSAAAKQPAK